MTSSESINKRRGHPGAGRKKTSKTEKGRQPGVTALTHVKSLLGDEEISRDLLIEYLHRIQDHNGYLSANNIAALAGHMKLAQAEVYEVATFYSHFDVVADGDAAPPAITIRVCDSISCQLAGAQTLMNSLKESVDPSEVRVVAAPCMGRCDSAPVVSAGQNTLAKASVDSVIEAITTRDLAAKTPFSPVRFEEYKRSGGYSLLQDCLAGEYNTDQIIEKIDQSVLRGMGGAGFPTGRKYNIVRGYTGPRLMAVNADEGEPGTFKDRHYLERDPHRFLEGMLIAAHVVEAETVYIYLRDEYPGIRSLLLEELEVIKQAGLANHVKIELRRGAGAYICGEESAMIESIEGKRGIPRNRPPYVAEKGLFGKPTLVNNVETLFWIRDIVEKGPEWFASAGVTDTEGWRSYSVSGRVNKPGVVLAPAGISVRELINEHCGGMIEGHEFKGYLPGGASGGILPASLGDEPLHFGTLEKHGCFIGSAAIVVFSDQDDMKDVALNLMKFFEDESCGQCTPCRVGTEKAVSLMSTGTWDTGLLDELTTVMTDASICGLGQAAGNPVKSVIRFFPEDLT